MPPRWWKENMNRAVRVDLLPMLLMVMVAVLLQGLLPVPPTVAASTVFAKDSEYENSKRHPTYLHC